MHTGPVQSNARISDRVVPDAWPWCMTGRGMLGLVSLALGLGCVVAAVPLLVYTTTLAVFGLPHVLMELDYLARRFGPRLDRPLVCTWGVLLLAVVVVRLLTVVGQAVPGGREVWELGLLIALVTTVVPALAPASWGASAGAITVLVLLILGWMLEPLTALVLLAVLHNLTPIGFLAERPHGRHRQRVLRVCALVGGALPVLIASGWLHQAVAPPGLACEELTFWPVGPLAAHLGVFVPAPVLDTAWAQPAFAAAVYLQCVHYFTVLYVLPRLAPATRQGTPGSSWSLSRTFVRRVVLIVGVLMLLGFVRAFAEVRAIYGLVAAVHAWIEIPLLLSIPALGPFPQEATA